MKRLIAEDGAPSRTLLERKHNSWGYEVSLIHNNSTSCPEYAPTKTKCSPEPF